ncbi:carbohydrate ABC transporter permease [Actinomadura citrea]|uniref:ABC-type glycerol-3-phosphate transport system permease component n=1 Tax=Actinomadura citrea TaxID=46158 RepID=A0A7Y9GJ36_9ACTN|nr:carbohydrate ABC transporter permease [Actinomadura citrea]NYE16310.1 ABC-type glycerol-3-phosphate transport system permease component [Actinomadura citrea]GGT95883.1 ABC transporter permease [Actinomadura citrea]
MAATTSSGPDRKGTRARDAFFYLFLTVFVLAVVAPVAWVLKMSLSTRADLLATPPPIVPPHPTLSNYTTVFGAPEFRRALLNSVLIAGATTLVSLTFGVLAAYPLARVRFRGKAALLTGFLALAFFPTVAIIAPLFKEFRELGLLDTYAAIIAVDSAFALPLTVWILTAFFRTLPRNLEEAARVDGASTFRVLTGVILPLSAPGVVTAGLLVFVFAWNEFLFANTFLFSQDHWPVTVAIPGFATTHTIDFGAQAAASITVTLPILVIVFVFQRRLVAGLMAGALKG